MTMSSVYFFRQYHKTKKKYQLIKILMEEKNHRLRNNLQTIATLLNLQIKQSSDVKLINVLEDNLGRIKLMDILQRKLYHESINISLSDYILEIASVTLETFGFLGIKIDYDLENIKLKEHQILSIGFIINELVTNSCKYAFPYVQEPLLKINLNREINDLKLVVSDNGFGFKYEMMKEKINEAFGLRLIQIQVMQLHGFYDFDMTSGTRFTMKFKPD